VSSRRRTTICVTRCAPHRLVVVGVYDWRALADAGIDRRSADRLVDEAVNVGSGGDVRAAWRLLEVRDGGIGV